MQKWRVLQEKADRQQCPAGIAVDGCEAVVRIATLDQMLDRALDHRALKLTRFAQLIAVSAARSAALHAVAARTEKWRNVEFGPDGANGAMLFDVETDPLELKNLADDPKFAPVRAELSAMTRKYAANVGKTQV